MQLRNDLGRALRVLAHLASQPKEGGTTAVEIAEAIDADRHLVTGVLRQITNRGGWITVDRNGHALRFALAVPATEVALGEVARDIGGSLRPSLEDWRDTSLDPDLEAATITVEKNCTVDGRGGVGTLNDLVQVLAAVKK